jgi:hypothetical protein
MMLSPLDVGAPACSRAMPPVGFCRSLTLFLGAALLVAGSSGCLSVRDEFSREEKLRQEDWNRHHAAALTPAPALRLTWTDALTRLRAGNEKIRSADVDCLRAEENRKQVRRSLVPLLSLQGGFNQALTHGSDIDPFTFAANVFFDVPGMVGYRLRHEAAELMVIRADLAREAVWREQVVELYRVFSQSAQQAGEQREITRALDLAAAPDAGVFRTALERRKETAGLAQTELRSQLGQLLGAPELRFDCDAQDLPSLAYDTPAGRPAAENLAHLPLRLAAVELVALRARELGVNLQYWPEVSVYISTPALYRRSGGDDNFWSSRDLFIGSNVYWTLDTRGRNASQKRVIAAEAELRRNVLANESVRLSHRIEDALDALARTEERLAALPANAPSTSLTASLESNRAALVAERREWQLILWFFDDTRWSGVPPLVTPAKLAAL